MPKYAWKIVMRWSLQVGESGLECCSAWEKVESRAISSDSGRGDE